MNSGDSPRQMCRYDEQVSGPPFVPLLGEYTQHVGCIIEGSIALSNYRVILQHREASFSVPLGLIEYVECKDIIYLHFFCKDVKSYRCSFSDSEACILWQRRICKAIALPVSIERMFAFTFYQWNLERKSDLHIALTYECESGDSDGFGIMRNSLFENEVKRMGFDLEGAWRITKLNVEYKLCPTYPRILIVPSSVQDCELERTAQFRSSRRIPAVVYRHPNGAVLARSSQPEVGWLGWRNNDDETLIKQIALASQFDSPRNTSESSPNINQPHPAETKLATDDSIKAETLTTEGDGDNLSKRTTSESSNPENLCKLSVASDHAKKMLIMDARSYATAVANRARGGGCECPEYYPDAEIQFMNLANIHTIRKSFFALRQLVALPSDIPNWLSMLENTRWLSHISGLLKSAATAAQAVAIEERSVLVHCSDGWDRTPQIMALAQLLMDPYYRTMKGFEVLVEREWLEFGHKFSDRCGCGPGSDDINERCPVFLQWLDCIQQLLKQFKTAFQFNEAYLIKLSQHVYSNLFGNFLVNSAQERNVLSLSSKTFSVWSLFKLDTTTYTNYLYKYTNQILWPSTHPKDIDLWTTLYSPQIDEGFCMQQTNGIVDEPVESESECNGELCKAKSCDNIAALAQYPTTVLTRRLSDPSIRDSFPNMAMLQSALGSECLDDAMSVNKSSDATTVADTPLESNDILEDESKETMEILTNGLKSLSHLFEAEDPPDEKVTPSMLKDLAKRSIEGSTDTLVAELGIIQDKPSDNSSKEESSVWGVSSNGSMHNGHEVQDSSQIKALETARTVEDSEPESCMREADKSNNASPNILCTTCMQNKKLLDQTVHVHRTSVDRLEGSCGHIGNKLGISIPNGNSVGKSSSHFTPAHSRTPSSGIPSTPSEERSIFGLPVSFNSFDGLATCNDEVNKRLRQINRRHKHELEVLKRELNATKSFYLKLLHTRHHHGLEHNTEDQVSLPESLTSESSLGHESELSDASWEAVDEASEKPTLWVPDHAVDCCQGCNSLFWIGKGRHHCRSCGQIFCAECSDQSVPLPKENLFYPVRVCGRCFNSILEMQKPQRGLAAA